MHVLLSQSETEKYFEGIIITVKQFSGGGEPLMSYIGMCRFIRFLFLRRVSVESGIVFEGTTGVYERIYRFNSK